MIDDATSPARRARVVLAHDWLYSYRGGEAVLERIASLVQREHELVAILTMFDSADRLAPTLDAANRRASWLNRLPASRRFRQWLLPLYPAAVKHLSAQLAAMHRAQPIDLLISSSSAAVKGIRPPEGVPHLCYCHAPARYVWSLTEEYSGGLRGVALDVASPLYRSWDRRTSAHVDRFIANSSYVARQIERCFGREATVVHPPVRTRTFTMDERVRREPFWLVVSALEPYKRVERAIEAAAIANMDLIIVGQGTLGMKLEDVIAHTHGSRARLLGRVPESELRSLYQRAAVLLYPQVEDFGISAVEAQACGCPVAARALGGATDTVIDGVTGVLFTEPTPGTIADAARLATSLAGTACRENALRFSEERFDERMRSIIRETLVARPNYRSLRGSSAGFPSAYSHTITSSS